MHDDELLDLEKQFWTAIQEQDAQTILRLTDDHCIVTGAQGHALLDKESIAGMMANATFVLHEFALTDAKVHRVTDDVAIIAYRVHEKLTVDGKPVELDAADASTWVRRGGAWRCALHTESIAGDPYGRDRKS